MLTAHYDIRVRLGGKTYIVPVCEDSDNKKTNFDFRNLPNISDEDCGIAMEIMLYIAYTLHTLTTRIPYLIVLQYISYFKSSELPMS